MILLALLLAVSVPQAPYERFPSGNPKDVKAPTRPLLVLQGGGDDVDANYARMGEAAGGGDFVVLRASGGDSYNEYIGKLCRCDSVETIVFRSREAASDPAVLETIRNAEAIWIAGGDQKNYVDFWKDTPVEEALNAHARRAPIGGTSAGMAILGEIVYSAASGESLTSEHGLADPFHPDVTLDRGFLALPYMERVITDQHWQERDRLGRTLVMLARALQDGPVRGIAADRETALHVGPDGMAEVFATPTHETPFVYFLAPSHPAERLEKGRPLTFTGVQVIRLRAGEGRFDVKRWAPADGARVLRYELSVRDGKVTSDRPDRALY